MYNYIVQNVVYVHPDFLNTWKSKLTCNNFFLTNWVNEVSRYFSVMSGNHNIPPLVIGEFYNITTKSLNGIQLKEIKEKKSVDFLMKTKSNW